MATYYVDSDGSGATAPYDTWAKAAQSLDTISALPPAGGDVIYCQGATVDTGTGARSITLANSPKAPVRVIGVKDGTTNAPPVSSDLCTRAGADHYVYESTTGSVSVVNAYHIHGLKLISASGSDLDLSPEDIGSATECIFVVGDDLWLYNDDFDFEFINCEIDLSLVSSNSLLWRLDAYCGHIRMLGGVITLHASHSAIFHGLAAGRIELLGVDLSGMPSGCDVHSGGSVGGAGIVLKHCSMGSGYGIFSSATDTRTKSNIKLIGCNTSSSLANDATYQDYEEDGIFGTVDNSTITRTGGASDETTANTDGAFSYAMVVKASSTGEGTNAAVESPWLAVWVPGGASKTLTVYIANSTASTDYQEDEVRCVFFTPDAGDTSQHDFNHDPPIIDFFGSSTTAITDDTGSTWDSGANNHQKFSTTLTPGYTGWAYARVSLNKRQVTPDTLYLDPKIEVT